MALTCTNRPQSRIECDILASDASAEVIVVSRQTKIGPREAGLMLVEGVPCCIPSRRFGRDALRVA